MSMSMVKGFFHLKPWKYFPGVSSRISFIRDEFFAFYGKKIVHKCQGRHCIIPIVREMTATKAIYTYMKLQLVKSEPQIIECRISNVEGRLRCAHSFFIKTDRIHSFEIRHSWFDIRYSLFRQILFRSYRLPFCQQTRLLPGPYRRVLDFF